MALSIENTHTSFYSTVSSNKNLTSTTSNESSFTIALQAFYEIHQRSQITGVATTEYNHALEDLGIDTSDTFAATKGINLLQSHGYDTNKPTDEAIATYGSLDVSYGNKSYMKNGTNIVSDALQDEIDQLNVDSNNAYEGAKNYYDIALKNIQNPSLKERLTSINTDEALKIQLLSNTFSNAQVEQNLLKEILENLV